MILPLSVTKNKFGERVADIDVEKYYRQIFEEVLEAHRACIENFQRFSDDEAGESTLLSRSGGEKGLRGGGAGKPQCSSRGRPGFRGTLWVASRVPRALSTSNS